MGTDVDHERDSIVEMLDKQPVGTDLLYTFHGELYRKRDDGDWCHIVSGALFPSLAFWHSEGTWVLL